ncbi:uncharacterized protein BKA78DRAFT_319496 [Phyllosticta capitalensis]|uniref:uncharacterized protein n=1 Tax=Phyllosticta capitalensis TaxID=121624 RepID=UPI00313000E8
MPRGSESNGCDLPSTTFFSSSSPRLDAATSQPCRPRPTTQRSIQRLGFTISIQSQSRPRSPSLSGARLTTRRCHASFGVPCSALLHFRDDVSLDTLCRGCSVWTGNTLLEPVPDACERKIPHDEMVTPPHPLLMHSSDPDWSMSGFAFSARR